MTPEEQKMLSDLANKVAQTPAPQQDPQAADFIRTRIGSRPDALYIMTQTVLIQNMALDQARQEIEQLKKASPSGAPSAAPSGGSFLGAQPYSGPTRGGATPVNPSPSQPPVAPQSGGSGGSGGGMPGFLQSAATTAAGVAAGALAFEGIRSLFGGGGLGSLGGFGGTTHAASSFLGGATPETIINNYYDRDPNSSQNGEEVDADTDSGVEDEVEDEDAGIDDNSGDADVDEDIDSVDDSFDDSPGSDDDLV